MKLAAYKLADIIEIISRYLGRKCRHGSTTDSQVQLSSKVMEAASRRENARYGVDVQNPKGHRYPVENTSVPLAVKGALLIWQQRRQA